MKRMMIASLVCLTSYCTAVAQEEDGFTDLYNGKDLTGFVTKGNWVPQDDGVLAIIPREGEKGWQRYGAYLYTEKMYENFSCDFEYKHEKGGNSGFFFRIADIKDPVKMGCEVQILDSYGKEKLGHHDCGGVIKTVGPSKNACKPAGEWNRMIVTIKDNQMTVNLNGQEIVDLDLSKSAIKDRPAKGYLAWQDHGVPMWFRNFRIKQL